MLKRTMSVILCLIIVLSIPLQSFAATVCYTNFYSAEYSSNPGQYMANIALAQNGRTGSDLGYSDQWCAYFVSDCARIAGQTAAIPAHGNVLSLYNNITNAGGVTIYDARNGTGSLSNSKIGDIAVLDTTTGGNTSRDHVEIVYAVSGSSIYTVGGNSGSGSSYSTRKVTKHSPYSSSRIVYIVRPNYEETRTVIPGKISVSAPYAITGDSVTFSFPAENAIQYELVITNITSNVRVMYTMTDASSFTYKFVSSGLYKIEVNAYDQNTIKGFESIYFEVHSGERPNTYINSQKGEIYFTPQEATILHAGEMQERLQEAILNIYKDGTLYYQGSMMSTGLYTSKYKKGSYEANVLLTYKSGYGIYTKTIIWHVGNTPQNVTLKQNVDECIVGNKVTFTVTADDATEYYLAIGNGNNTIYELTSNSNVFTYTFNQQGLYYIWASATNKFGTTASSPSNLTINVTEAKYTIAFNSNGGTDAPSSQTKIHDTDMTLSTVVPTKANYNFIGWNTKADGTGKTYQPGDIYTANEDLTLYAIWELAHSHSYAASVTKQPTCTEKGTREYTCSSCGDTYTEDIAALGHNYAVSGMTEATCYESGFTTYECTRCDSSYNTDFTEALNHPSSSWVTVVNPTASSNGLAEKQCDYCGHTSEQFIIPALVPDYVTGVSLSSHKETVEIGDEFTLKATVTPDTAKDKTVIWSSRNPEIATVSNGTVKAIKPGTTAIVAETKDGGYIDFCIVSVLSIASFNGSVVDNSNKIIYGLSCNLDSIDEYIKPADSSMSIVLDSAKIGTGTTVSIVDSGEIVDSYEIVVFGDIDGNGLYDANDAFLVNMINAGLISVDNLGIAERTAADCNHDGIIDEADFELLVQAGILLDEVKQSAENGDISTSSLYIDYCSVISQSAEIDTEADNSNITDTTTSEDITYNFDFISFFHNILGLLSKIFGFIVALF